MGASTAGIMVTAVLAGAIARPAAAQGCPETERDERGRCPAKPAPSRKAPARSAPPKAPARPAPSKAPARPAPPPALSSPAIPRGSCPADMVRVPAGTFQMGRPKEAAASVLEKPPHEVTLSAYCIDRTEVTVKAYAACVAAGGCAAPPLTVRSSDYSVDGVKLYSRLCNRGDRPDHPINCVDWGHAAAYCRWAGKRLPTEAEWEHAARGGDDRLYPWGNEPPSERRLNSCGTECSAMGARVLGEALTEAYNTSDGWETTAPVGRFPAGASPFGALDMAGNVWEWTADWFARYAPAAVTDPRGPEKGDERVYRGGGWIVGRGLTHELYRTTYRNKDVPTARYHALGFRCARGD